MKINQVLESVTSSSSTSNTGGGQAPTFGRSNKFLEDELKETTSSGAIATVAAPVGKMQKRGGGSMFKGIKTSKKFVNSPMSEADISENDLIIVPGQMSKRSRGFMPRGTSRVDHEVEMARSDLIQCAKNAKQIHGLIKDLSEQDGLEGWVQEKITKAEDYLNTVRAYLEGKQHSDVDEDMMDTIKSGISKVADTVSSAVKDVSLSDFQPYNTPTAAKNYQTSKPQIAVKEAANPAQQAAIAIAKKKEQGVSEGAVKTLSMDLTSMSDKEFIAKYKKTKAEMRASMKR